MMKWFDTMMWGWLRFYADILTAAGLIGLFVLLVRGVMAIGDFAERAVKRW